jgi:hypothetical protein
MKEEKQKPIKVTALIDADLVKWVDKMVEKGTFDSRSHGFELAMKILRGHPELIIEDLPK